MGIKKKCRAINQAKNKFLQWLKENKAESIEVYGGGNPDSDWDYYRVVSAFIGDSLYMVYFMMWKDAKETIDYSDDENSYKSMNVEEFLQLIQ